MSKKLKGNCQFRYVLQDARVTCPHCITPYTKEPNKHNKIDDFMCEVCGYVIKVPHHYIDTYHNKQCITEVNK